MPGMPRCSRTCASGTCNCSSTASSRSTVPEVPAQALDGGGDLPGVERVIDPPVPGQPAAQLAGQAFRRLAGDQGQLDVGHAGRGVDEAARRLEQIRRDKGGDHHAWELYPLCCPARLRGAWRRSLPSSLPTAPRSSPFSRQRRAPLARGSAARLAFGHERRVRRAVLPGQPAPLRPRAGRGRRDGDRHRRVPRRRPGRPAQGLAAPLRAGAVGHRRRGDDRARSAGCRTSCGWTGSRPRSRRTRCPRPRSGRPARSRARRCGRPGCAGTSRR